MITVSDSRTVEDDEGGSTVVGALTAAGHVVVSTQIVPDDRAAIKTAIAAALSAGVDLVVTTGGTGIAPRDVTYEVVEAVLEKVLDGFGEAFRRLSWDEVGARSILSRAIGGSVGRSLLFALPGSPKAARLAMTQIVVPVLGHAVGLLRGE
ncbi:MAG: molybdenum cofactor biosynthesis protein MoaB [Polyangiales bacterium]